MSLVSLSILSSFLRLVHSNLGDNNRILDLVEVWRLPRRRCARITSSSMPELLNHGLGPALLYSLRELPHQYQNEML